MSPRTPSRRWVSVLILSYLLVVVFVVFIIKIGDFHLPEVISGALHSLQQHGFAMGVRFGHVEAAANVLFFVPLGALIPLRLRQHRWLIGWLVCVGISLAIEAVQLAFLSDRFGSVRDIICNSIGAGLGVLLTWGLSKSRVGVDPKPPVQSPR